MSNTKPTSGTISKTLKLELRANAHHLKPVVMIGQDGITDGVLKEIDINLQAHTLIKVRILAEDSSNNKSISTIICDKLHCHLIQSIGKLLVIYREGNVVLEHKHIENLSKKPTMPAPREVKVRKVTRDNARRRSPIKIITILGNQRVTAGGLVKKKRLRQISKKKQFSE